MSAKHTIPGPRGPEKDPAWFSWRHQTRAEHDAARETRQSQHGPAARRRRAAERLAVLDAEVADWRQRFGEAEESARDAVLRLRREARAAGGAS